MMVSMQKGLDIFLFCSLQNGLDITGLLVLSGCVYYV